MQGGIKVTIDWMRCWSRKHRTQGWFDSMIANGCSWELKGSGLREPYELDYATTELDAYGLTNVRQSGDFSEHKCSGYAIDFHN